MSKTIAVIAAHPDDEILGCGGAIAKHVQNGDTVHVLIISEGLTSRDHQRNRESRSDELSKLAQCAHQANKSLGVDSISLLDFPDNRMDGVDLLDIIKSIENFIDQKQPSKIYTHFGGDVNIDHQKIFEAVMTASRSVPGQIVKEIWCFEVQSSTEWCFKNKHFQPNAYINISNQLDSKIEALKFYACEMRDWPHSRSYQAVEYLARWRGSNIGCDAAEAFMIQKYIVD